MRRVAVTVLRNPVPEAFMPGKEQTCGENVETSPTDAELADTLRRGLWVITTMLELISVTCSPGAQKPNDGVLDLGERSSRAPRWGTH